MEKETSESEEAEFPEEYYKLDWNDTPAATEDEKILTQNDFYNMSYGYS